MLSLLPKRVLCSYAHLPDDFYEEITHVSQTVPTLSSILTLRSDLCTLPQLCGAFYLSVIDRSDGNLGTPVQGPIAPPVMTHGIIAPAHG